jgi:hypothetical protein
LEGKLKKLADKSPLELEAWEIDSLQQIAIEQIEEIERLKRQIKTLGDALHLIRQLTLSCCFLCFYKWTLRLIEERRYWK